MMSVKSWTLAIPELVINNVTVGYSDSVKVLEIIIDCNLNCREHARVVMD